MDSASGGSAFESSSSGGPAVPMASLPESSSSAHSSRYESQKRRDWNAFLQYLKNHKPPLALGRCSGAHVIEFLKYLDQFGKTKVHMSACQHFGHPNPPAACACPFKQAWGSLDAMIGRLRAAYEENGGRQETNPFAAKAVRIYLREVREGQAKARGIPYEKRKRKKPELAAPEVSPRTESPGRSERVEVGEGRISGGAEGGSSGGTTADHSATAIS